MSENVYSHNGEEFQDDLDDAVLELCESDFEAYQKKEVVIYEGTKVEYAAEDFCPDANWVIERMTAQAHDIIGEYAEDWFSVVTKEQQEKLNVAIKETIHSWAGEWGMGPKFWGVKDVKQVTVENPHFEEI